MVPRPQCSLPIEVNKHVVALTRILPERVQMKKVNAIVMVVEIKRGCG